MNNVRILCFLALLMSNIYSCSGPKEQGGKKMTDKRVLRLSTSTEELVQHAYQAMSYQQLIILDLLNDSLFEIDKSNKIVSKIAKRWSLENSGRVLKIELDNKSIFSNGEKITSKDVAESISMHFAPQSKSVVGSALGLILESTEINIETNILKSISIVSNNTFTIHLKDAYPNILRLLAHPGFSISKNLENDTRAISSGPYRWEGVSGEHSKLLKNSHYRHESALFDEIQIVKFKELEDIKQALEGDVVDMAIGAPIEFIDVKHLPSKVKMTPSNTLVITNAYLNFNRNSFKSKNLRCVIRNTINNMSYKPGRLSPADLPTSNIIPFGILPKNYYQKKVMNTGPENTHTTTTSMDVIMPMGLFSKEYIEALREEFKKIKIDLNFTVAKGHDFLNPILSGNFDIAYIPFLGLIPDPDGYVELFNPNGFLKSAGIPTEALRNELSSARFNENNSDRLDAYAKAFTKFENECFVIPVAQQNIPILHKKTLTIPELRYRFHVDLRSVK
jgi:ABC-type transport system substrate-binding protein